MNILYVYSDDRNEWNCSEWRCQIPMDAINKSGLASAHMISMDEFAQNQKIEDVEAADIVVIQRNLFGAAIVVMMNYRLAGKTFVLDVDDAYHLMPSSVLSAPFWRVGQGKKDGKPFKLPFNPLQQLEIGARLVNAVTAPSQVLVDYWSKMGPAYLVPNYPRLAPFLNAYDSIPTTDKASIGWGGSYSHIDSFMNSNVVPALRRIIEKYNVDFLIGGGDDRLPIAMKIRSAKLLPWAKYDQWPEILRKFSVGIAPLSGAYDDNRSPIKILDYMLMGIPWIATNAKPYHAFAEYGTLVENRAKTWEAALDKVLHEPDMEQVKRAREFALTFDVDLHVQELVDIYQHIIDEGRSIL
jgi:glycosyltransferase involved in cell wall biosynthesis